YMAAEKMIVSTPITDVAEPYGDIVFLGDTPAEFIRACEKALEANDRDARVSGMRKVLSRTSWDTTAASIERLISEAIAHQPSQREGSVAAAAQRNGGRVADRRGAVIVGAGPTGLSAAYHLGEDSLLIEQNNRVGGWCRSIEENGFTFDYAGHIMFSSDPYV